jgi:hypothetical protein
MQSKRLRLVGALFAGATALSSAGPVQADTIFSDFDTGQPFFSALLISSTSAPFEEFTSPGNYSVTQIDLVVGYLAGKNGVVVSLYSDNAGFPGPLSK